MPDTKYLEGDFPFRFWSGIGVYDISAEDLLAGSEGTKAGLKQEQAMKLIYECLSDGREVFAAELHKEAIEHGISERTVRMVRNSMKDKLGSERQVDLDERSEK